MKAHGPTPHPQHRVKAPGGAGLPGWRDAPQPCLSARPVARPDPHLDSKSEGGAFDAEAAAVDTIEAYEARIAALERLVGRQALEIEFLKGALKHGQRPRSATTSVVTGPAASLSRKDAG
jgi:hypothetical protein